MIALYIILGIIAFIFILLMFSARFRIIYGDEFSVTLKYLFIKYQLFPQKEKPKKSKSEKPKEEKKEPTKKKVDESIKKQGFADTFSQIKDEIAPTLKSLGKFIHHIRVNPLKFKLIMAGKDAGDLAIDYGRLCAVFYPALAFLCENMKFGKKQVYIGVDYVKEKHEIMLDTTVKIRLIFVLALGIKLLLKLIKIKLKSSTNNTVGHKVGKNKIQTSNMVIKERNVAK